LVVKKKGVLLHSRNERKRIGERKCTKRMEKPGLGEGMRRGEKK
jgi:hypothetical protein